MPIVCLGNAAALDQGRQIPGNQITTAHVPDDYAPSEQLLVITAERATGSVHDGVWHTHSSFPGPAWVESDDADLAERIATHYGCPIGRPDDWEPVE